MTRAPGLPRRRPKWVNPRPSPPIDASGEYELLTGRPAEPDWLSGVVVAAPRHLKDWLRDARRRVGTLTYPAAECSRFPVRMWFSRSTTDTHAIFTSELPTRTHLACPVCGATRLLEKFGIWIDSVPADAESSVYRFKVSIQETGSGYKGISWAHYDPTPEVLIALRNRMRLQLDDLDATLSGEDGERIRCLACGTRVSAEALGIIEGSYDPEDAPSYQPVQEKAVEGENGRLTWETSALTIDYARALAQRLRAEAERLESLIAEVEG